MKKIGLFALLCVVFSSGKLRAQDSPVFGLKAGGSFGNARVESFETGNRFEYDTSYRTSFYGGGFVEYWLEAISENLYTQLELRYVNGGYLIDDQARVSHSVNRLSQLQLPFLLKYRIGGLFLVTTGIYWGLVLKVEEESPEGLKTDLTQEFATFDSGLLVGAEIPVGKRVFLELRYNHGLLDVIDLEKTVNRRSFFTRSIQLGVGVGL